MRVDTGPLFGRETRAWVAAVRQEATDWVQGSARNEREHVAAKLVSSHGRLDLTSYLSYDSIHEDVYQRLYSEADFDGFPNGTSDYWSGAKANRFIDPMNLGGVEVSQGTADIASRGRGDVQLPDGRSGGRADLHGIDDDR